MVFSIPISKAIDSELPELESTGLLGRGLAIGYLAPMLESELGPMGEEAGGIRSRGEEVIGELAQSLLENPTVQPGPRQGARRRRAGGGGAARGAQRARRAKPGDLQRLSRRVRALSDRLEALEDEIDRLRRDRSA